MISFLQKYLGKWYWPTAWTMLIGILLCLPGSVLPNETHFAIPQFDKIVHIGLFGGFVFLWNLYLSNRGFALKKVLTLFFIVFLLAEAYGIGMEYVQKYYIPLRDYDQADIIADLIGAGLAYGLSTILLAAGKNERKEVERSPQTDK
jgi:VanZ family protein